MIKQVATVESSTQDEAIPRFEHPMQVISRSQLPNQLQGKLPS